MSGSWRVVPGCHFREYLAGKAFPRGSRETFCPEVFLCMTCLPFTHAIYSLITYTCKGGQFREKNLRYVFYNTHTHLLERELLILSEKSLSHSSLVRNHCSIFSFPLPLSYVERRFVPKHNSPTQSVESILELGKLWEIAKRSRWGLADAIGRIAGSGKLNKTQFREALLE